MSTTYKLETPFSVGSLTQPSICSELKLTGIWITTTPELAQIGHGEAEFILTETSTGWQETLAYKSETLVDLWSQAVTVSDGQTLADVLSTTIFTRLVADGKLPAGTVMHTADEA